MAPRAYWKGHVRLSLVSFPVQLHSATVSGSRISFHQIHRPTGQRVRHQKVVPELGPIENEDIIKGYEVSKNQYVTFEPEELEALRVESSHTIDLVQFVEMHEIDPLYFEKPYFLVPEGKMAQEAFRVIRKALADTRKVALGQVVLSGREHPVAIKPCGKGMLLETLRSADEVKRGAPFFAEIEDGEVDEDQLALARQLIERKSAPFDPERFVDHYEAALRELIEAKAAGQEIQPERPAASGGVVIDLMQALKKSLADDRSTGAAKAKPKSEGRAEPKSAEVREFKPQRKGKGSAAKEQPSPPPASGGAGPTKEGGESRGKSQPRRRKAG
jgi:DNA end-binding protein Ku